MPKNKESHFYGEALGVQIPNGEAGRPTEEEADLDEWDGKKPTPITNEPKKTFVLCRDSDSPLIRDLFRLRPF